VQVDTEEKCTSDRTLARELQGPCCWKKNTKGKKGSYPEKKLGHGVVKWGWCAQLGPGK